MKKGRKLVRKEGKKTDEKRGEREKKERGLMRKDGREKKGSMALEIREGNREMKR